MEGMLAIGTEIRYSLAAISATHVERRVAGLTTLAQGGEASGWLDHPRLDPPLGHHEQALEIGVQVLERWRRILGDEHPDTMSAKSYLATIESELEAS